MPKACNACHKVEQLNSDSYLFNYTNTTTNQKNVIDLLDPNFPGKLDQLYNHSGLCSVHSPDQAQLFCKDCKQITCLDCHFQRKEHQNHTILPIKQSTQNIQTLYQNIFNSLQQYEADINT